MSRSMTFGLALGAVIALTSAAGAALIASPSAHDGSSLATQVQYYGYDCPPGYKATKYGGCKLSHYLRRHPDQMPGYYGYRRRDTYYDDEQPRDYRRYYRRDYQDDDGNWDD